MILNTSTFAGDAIMTLFWSGARSKQDTTDIVNMKCGPDNSFAALPLPIKLKDYSVHVFEVMMMVMVMVIVVVMVMVMAMAMMMMMTSVNCIIVIAKTTPAVVGAACSSTATRGPSSIVQLKI
jgi:hypothetical protein